MSVAPRVLLPRPCHLSRPIPGRSPGRKGVDPRSSRRKRAEALFFQQVPNPPPGRGEESQTDLCMLGNGVFLGRSIQNRFFWPSFTLQGPPSMPAFVVFSRRVAAGHVGCGGSSFLCGGGCRISAADEGRGCCNRVGSLPHFLFRARGRGGGGGGGGRSVGRSVGAGDGSPPIPPPLRAEGVNYGVFSPPCRGGAVFATAAARDGAGVGDRG